MTPVHQMLIIALAGIFGFLLITVIVMALRPSPHATDLSLPTEVIERSKKYINTLSKKPFSELKTNQKLILIHSYYNIGNHKTVVQYAETMINELRQLPPERKMAFIDIIENSYRQLGQSRLLTEFREAVGL